MIEKWRTHFEAACHAGDVELGQQRKRQRLGVVPVKNSVECTEFAAPEIVHQGAQERGSSVLKHRRGDRSKKATREELAREQAARFWKQSAPQLLHYFSLLPKSAFHRIQRPTLAPPRWKKAGHMMLPTLEPMLRISGKSFITAVAAQRNFHVATSQAAQKHCWQH